MIHLAKRAFPAFPALPALLLALLIPVALAGDEREDGPEAPKRPELTVGTRVGQRLPQFKTELWDVSGNKPRKSAFDSHQNTKPTAYVFMSKTCPWCRLYEKRLAKMSAAYGKRGLRFIIVYPTRKTPAEQKIAYHKKSGFSVPMVNDKNASIAALLRITKTPEIVLVAKDGKIVFRGGIDDSPRSEEKVEKAYLKTACDDLIAGRKVSVTSAPLYG
jgi:thiol-disulfide isomerase/thioredoxin